MFGFHTKPNPIWDQNRVQFGVGDRKPPHRPSIHPSIPTHMGLGKEDLTAGCPRTQG
jgi:hypothetical protein